MKEKIEFYEDIKQKAYILFEQGNNIKEISTILKIDRHTISRYLRNKGYQYSKCGKIDIESNIFNIVDSEEKAYWLGFLYADGYISKTKYAIELTVANKDREHLEKFKKFLSYKGKIYYRKSSNSNRILFRDRQIHSDLNRLGCINNKSLVLKFPDRSQLSWDFLSPFIRGYFDGDGYIRGEKSPIEMTLLGTKEFLQGMINILSIRKELKKDKRHLDNTYYISLCGEDARIFGKFLYQNSTISLDRKKNRFLNHLKKSTI